MTALLRYRAALLVRSQRWLAPVLLYAAFVGIGVQAGQPVLDSSATPPPGSCPSPPGSSSSASTRNRPPPGP